MSSIDITANHQYNYPTMLPGGTMPGSEKSEGTWIVWWEWWEYEREFYLISSSRIGEGLTSHINTF